jgi:peptide/nickel transport system substrate-binding protein
MARTYVGRIVFASFCDKLFDIDEKLNIVPQLALIHETSADGKEVTIKLRPGVKFHDGEAFDAEAAKFSLERHLTFPARSASRNCAARSCRRRRSPHHQAVLEGALLAAGRAAHRSRRHDGVAQGGERSRRQVRTAAGLRRSLQIRRTRAAGPHGVRKFADYWNKDNVFIDRIVFLPLVDATVRLANLKSGGLDLIERCSRPTSRTCVGLKLKLSTRSRSAIRA